MRDKELGHRCSLKAAVEKMGRQWIAREEGGRNQMERGVPREGGKSAMFAL